MTNKLSNIREVKQLPKNSEFSILCVITKLTRRLDRNDNPFWDITVADATGDMEGKAWYNASWFNHQAGDRFPIDPDNCGFPLETLSFGIVGTIADYKGQVQYTFNELYVLDQNKYPPQKFARRSPVQQEFLESTFKDLVNEISYKPLQNFVNAVFFKHTKVRGEHFLGDIAQFTLELAKTLGAVHQTFYNLNFPTVSQHLDCGFR